VAPIDVQTLKREQDRIGTEIQAAKDKLAGLDASHTEWQQILDLAMQVATHCPDAYRKADDPTRTPFNQAVFDRIEVRDGQSRPRRTASPSTCSSA